MKKALFLGILFVLFAAFSVFAQENGELLIQEPAPAPVQSQTAQSQQTQSRADHHTVDFNLNFSNIGFGLFLPFDGQYIVEMSVELLQFGINFRGSGLSMNISPFNYYGWFGGEKVLVDDGSGSMMPKNDSSFNMINAFSFINVGLYWSFLGVLGVEDDSFFISPFITFNYLFYENDLDMDRFMFSGGVQGGIYGSSGRIKYKIFTIDAGFRMIKDEFTSTGKFFIGIKYDPMMNWWHTRKSN